DIPETYHVVSVADLPATWQDEQQIEVLQSYLQDWLDAPDKLSVSVPSAIVDRSRNYLVHTLHPSFEEAVKIMENAPFRIDGRLLKANG
ncbi:RES family NAD+ phosphorylase, partial [Spirosoma lituiforme]